MNNSTTIPNGRNDPLLLAGRILTIIMQGVMAIIALGVTIAIPVLFLFHDEIQTDLIAKHGGEISAFPAWQIAGILLLALALIATAFVFFGKLRAIINSVGDGDPFAPENADRLTAMAWLSLGAYAIMAMMVGVALTISEWASQIDGEEMNFELDFGFDLTGILMIIVLFILARVFRHGAAMRDDLEGTV
ncbi:MAG: DUF2975 domain-containing protein [Erythrobacter sp.]